MKPSPGPISDWARTPAGDLLLVDEFHNRVLVDGRDGMRVAPGEFCYPRGIAVLGDVAYVVDSWTHRVQAFRLPQWKREFEFGGFFCPSGIAVTNGLLVVADTNNRRLSFHAPDGTPAFTYELEGFPKRVAVDSAGYLVVHYDDGRSEPVNF
ncbi:MAG TPA: hypothetical protein VK210_02120 [Terriglobia bacterium]|nr:hypothetical protein [Terriglobia bacterium]